MQSTSGVPHVVIENVSMSDVAGDCVYFGLGADRSSGAVRDSSCRRTSRNGVSVTAGDDILVERTTTNKIGHIVFDVEPNSGRGNWGSCRVTFDSNTIRTYWLYAWTVIPNAPICDQAFTNNRVVGQGLAIAAIVSAVPSPGPDGDRKHLGHRAGAADHVANRHGLSQRRRPHGQWQHRAADKRDDGAS